MTFGANWYGIVIIRYSMLYAPPDLFGCLSGTLYTLLTFGMLAGYVILIIITNILNVNTLENYQIQFFILGVASVVLSLALVEYWGVFPPPDDVNAVDAVDETYISVPSDIEIPMTVQMAPRSPNENSELLCDNVNTNATNIPVSCPSRNYREDVILRLVLLLALFFSTRIFLGALSTDASIATATATATSTQTSGSTFSSSNRTSI